MIHRLRRLADVVLCYLGIRPHLYGDGVTDDSRAAQTMLDAYGSIRITRPGTYDFHGATLYTRQGGRPAIDIGPGAHSVTIRNAHIVGHP